MISAFDMVENFVGGENAVYQHFCPFPKMFSKGSFFRVVKIRDYVVKSSAFQLWDCKYVPCSVEQGHYATTKSFYFIDP